MFKILCIICFFIFPSVSAKEYYGEYSTYSSWSFDEVIPTDTIYVEKVPWYKYYKEDIKGTYYIEGENPSDYVIDKNNFYYTNFTNYSLDIPSNIKNRVIEKKEVYQYIRANKVRYIKFTNIKGGYGSLRFSEIYIEDKNGHKIDYKYTCLGCNEDFDRFIRNGNVIENKSYIGNGGELIIDLGNAYSYDNFKISISLIDITYDTKTFDMILYDDKEVFQLLFRNNFYTEYLSDVVTFTYDYTNLEVLNLWDENVIEVTEPIERAKQIGKNTYYRYSDLYYYYYKKDKIYTDYMSYQPEEYPYKSDEYKYAYRYKIRNKIVIPEEIVIDSNTSDISSFIESNTNYSKEGDIDYSKNGIYDINIIFENKKIPLKVKVDIEENSKYETLDKDYQNLLTDYEKTQKLLEDKNNEYDNMLKDKDNLINELDNKNIQIYNEMIAKENDYKIEISGLNLKLLESENQIEKISDSKYKQIKELENEIINLKSEDKSFDYSNYIYIGVLILSLLIHFKKKN